MTRNPAKLNKFLGELEQEVMAIAWQRERVSVRDVLDELKRRKRLLAYTTVMTVMGRLEKKGWLHSQREGRAYIYHPAYGRDEAEAVAVGKMVHELVREHGDLAIAQFMKEVGGLSAEDLAKLAALMENEE